jgi:hypothetical protein
MYKEIGKWLMDVAKYVMTASLISTFLGGLENFWVLSVVGVCIVGLFLGLGLYFINLKK